MSKTCKLLRIVTAVATVLILCLLAWFCLDMYIAGKDSLGSIFTREMVAARLSVLYLPFIGYLILIIITTVLSLKGAEKENAVPLSAENKLRLVKRNLTEIPAAAVAEEKKRRMIVIGCALLVILCCVPCALYLFDGANFESWDLEMVVGELFIHILPWVLLSFALIIAADILVKRSVLSQIEIIKAATVKPIKKEKNAVAESKLLMPLRIAITALAIVFIILGVNNGGLRDVLVKAINICTECIGLG